MNITIFFYSLIIYVVIITKKIFKQCVTIINNAID